MRTALVFGGSGPIGAALLARMAPAGWTALAVSRDPQPDRPGVRWLRGDLARCDGLPMAVDAIFSCGPLDHFARWHAHAGIDAPRVIAFGSTSAAAKESSPDAAERALAARLREAETRLLATASARGVAATVLRPTLVYGDGRDRTVSRIGAMARRLGWFMIPRGATGLRQPVHVDDLAAAALAAGDAPAAAGRIYDLPGGEALPWRDMVARTLASQSPPPRLFEVPMPLFRLALGAARLAGRGDGFGTGALARLREDLVFDASPARADFGYAPRAFQP
ncbi:MAG: NAD-dependent epimerase/dehydratase family protein [Luteimonas sp.]